MKLQYLVKRGIYYLRTGATIVTFPLSLGTFVKVVYPKTDLITLFLLLSIIGLAVGVGYMWLKKSGIHQAEIDVVVEANPYQNIRFVPNVISIYEGLTELFEKNNIECEEVKTLLRNSGSKKYGEKQK